MSGKSGYRLLLKFQVGKKLGTDDPVLTARVAGKEVSIRSAEGQHQPLSEASWLILRCAEFDTEKQARRFGEELRRAVHMAGLCARVGADAKDPGEDETRSWFDPHFISHLSGGDAQWKIAPDVHGIVVVPNDGEYLVLGGQASADVLANSDGFVQALADALPQSTASRGPAPLRRAVRLLNLAEMNKEPFAKVVLSIATVEGLAPRLAWSSAQRELIRDTADQLESDSCSAAEVNETAEALRNWHQKSIGKGVRELFAENELMGLWADWNKLYGKRSRLFHDDRSGDDEQRGKHLDDLELHKLGQEAVKLCASVVLSMCKREGIPVPSYANRHFNIQ